MPIARDPHFSLCLLGALLIVVSACSNEVQQPPTTDESSGTLPSVATTTLPTTTSTAATTTSSTDDTTIVPPVSIAPVTVERLAHSWHEGCPIPVEDLRLVRVPFLDFDGREATGEIVVHVEFADQLLAVFQSLMSHRYPIESVIPIGDLPEGAEDEPGYNNTSVFHCRFVEGTSRWSRHAFGQAIDINPFQNPFIRGDYIWPAGSQEFLDRALDHPAMIRPDDPVVTAFEEIGWPWGGNWSGLKDYQHFSSTGT